MRATSGAGPGQLCLSNPEVRRLIKKNVLEGIAGSDNHVGIQKLMGGVYLPERIKNVGEFIGFVKSGEAIMFVDRYDEDGNRL